MTFASDWIVQRRPRLRSCFGGRCVGLECLARPNTLDNSILVERTPLWLLRSRKWAVPHVPYCQLQKSILLELSTDHPYKRKREVRIELCLSMSKLQSRRLLLLVTQKRRRFLTWYSVCSSAMTTRRRTVTMSVSLTGCGGQLYFPSSSHRDDAVWVVDGYSGLVKSYSLLNLKAANSSRWCELDTASSRYRTCADEWLPLFPRGNFNFTRFKLANSTGGYKLEVNLWWGTTWFPANHFLLPFIRLSSCRREYGKLSVLVGF